MNIPMKSNVLAYWKDNLIRFEGPGKGVWPPFSDMWNASNPKKDTTMRPFKDDTLAEQALRLAGPSQAMSRYATRP